MALGESEVLIKESTSVPPEPAPGGILRELWGHYSDTVGARILQAGFGLVTGMLLPRLLGPQGRGELAAALLWPLFLTFIVTLGIDHAAVFFSSKNRSGISAVGSACLVIGSAQSLLVILVGFVVVPLALNGYKTQVVRLGLLFLFSVPLIQANNYGANVLLGNLKTGWYNAASLLSCVPYTVGVCILFLVGRPSLSAIVLLQVVGYASGATLAGLILIRVFHTSWHWDVSLFREMLKYGVKTQAGRITYFMNQRLDQLLISLLFPSTELGIYVAAVALADGLAIIPRALGTVTLAVGSNSNGAGAYRWAKQSLVLTGCWLVPAAIALWFLCPLVIPLVFGAQFTPSVLPCRILILGTCASGLSTILGEAARSVGQPESASYAEIVGLVVTVVLLALLLKPFGPAGAAAASSAAYTATLAVNLGYFRKMCPKAGWEKQIADLGREI